MNARLAVLSLAALFGFAGNTAAQEVVVSPDRGDAVYAPGQTVNWRVEWRGDAPPDAVAFTLKRDGLAVERSGDLPLRDGRAELTSAFAGPGTMLLEARAKGPDGKERRGVGGAVAAPDRIAPSAPRPDDFDAFWQAKIRDLQAIPPNPQLTDADAGRVGVRYAKLTMDNIGGTRIRGQVARPAAGERFPAVLIVQWAGVYGLPKSFVTDRAADGWLALNIQAHDLPLDEPEAFYKARSAGPLKNYPAIGNDDRDTSYFLRMYLSCYRAAEYLTTRPDWDGRTLVVMGGSQGGMQALVTAALHPKVTAAMANVPAGCDMLGPRMGRKAGWPNWYDQTAGKDAARVHEASRYFDVVNFATLIRCPVLVGVGLKDETCPPAGILAATNLVTSPKEVVLLPDGAHQEINGSHDAYDKRCWSAWLPALRDGKPAPVDISTAAAN